MIKEVDINGDGNISFNEFKDMMGNFNISADGPLNRAWSLN